MTLMSHNENCGVHHRMCGDPQRCRLEVEIVQLREEAKGAAPSTCTECKEECYDFISRNGQLLCIDCIDKEKGVICDNHHTDVVGGGCWVCATLHSHPDRELHINNLVEHIRTLKKEVATLYSEIDQLRRHAEKLSLTTIGKARGAMYEAIAVLRESLEQTKGE